jgi:anti-sigma factor RsiW
MNTETSCSQTLLLQADFDGELDAVQSAALEDHRAQCPICVAASLKLRQSSHLLRNARRFVAPEELHRSIGRQLSSTQDERNLQSKNLLNRSGTKKTRYSIFGAGAGVGAMAAGLLVFVFLGMPGRQMPESIVDNHVRAMQSPAHLLDVASTEHHTVKPWFAGQLDFAPPVKDMEAFGYPLRGGRVDVIEGRNVAVLVYQAGRHSIDVSVRLNPESAAASSALHGFNIRHWNDDAFSLWAVSDLNARELDAFVEHWKAAR